MSGVSRRQLLGIPFDQYQRYRVTTAILDGLGVDDGACALDVGGASGPASAFLDRLDVTVLDTEGYAEGRFVLGDGALMPFPAGTFDVVVSHDALEHVPPARRGVFLAETRRVARGLIVLCAPFSDELVELADAALFSFIEQRFGGFETLRQHLDYGLPLLDETVKVLGDEGWSTAVLPSGYLPHWFAAMLVHHELLAVGVEDLSPLHAYYNASVSPSDCREPAYRQVIVASSTHSQRELEAVTESLRCDTASVGEARQAVRNLGTAVLSERLSRVFRTSEHELEDRIEVLKRQIVDREAHIIELREQMDVVRQDLSSARNALDDARSLTRRIGARLRRPRGS